MSSLKNGIGFTIILVSLLFIAFQSNTDTSRAADEHLPVRPNVNQGEDDLDMAINQAIANYNNRYNMNFKELGRDIDSASRSGIVYLAPADATGHFPPGKVDVAIVTNIGPNSWNILLPGEEDYQLAHEALPNLVKSRINTTLFEQAISPPNSTQFMSTDYEFPWTDSWWATVTRSFNEHGVGEIDFDIDDPTTAVVAAKAGTIIYANDSHTLNTNLSGAWWYWNTVVIQHSANEFTTYAHLAHNSVPSSIKSQCSTNYGTQNCLVAINAGDVIGIQGNTGTSTNPHLHMSGGTTFVISSYAATQDEDNDGNTSESVYTGYSWNLANFAFQGYSISQVAAWPYGTRLQANHGTGGGDACSAPALNNPPDGYVSGSQTITFSWSSISGCTYNGYTFRIKNTNNMDSGGTTIVDTGEGGTSRTETIGSQWNNQDLYWGVRAANAPNGASWAVRRFRIEPGGGGNVQLCTSDDGNSGCTSYSVGEHDVGGTAQNDVFRSVKVPNGMSILIFRDGNFESTAECYSGNRAPLPQGEPWDLRGQVTSFKVYGSSNCPSSELPTILVYDGQNFGSYYWGMGRGTGFMDIFRYGSSTYYNDQAESIKVRPGWSVRLYEHSDNNNRGQSSSCLTGDVSSLGGLNNQASGIEIFNNTTCSSPATPTPTTPPTQTLSAAAVCNGPNLNVSITQGDGPFTISASAGINLPVSGVSTGTTTINGPEKWDDVTVSETSGDFQSFNLGQFKCRTEERPVLFWPAHQARITTSTLTLWWTGISNASLYRLMLFDDKVVANRTVDIRQNTAGSEVYLPLTQPLPVGRYFWRVRGRQNRVWSQWSTRFTLFIDPPTFTVTTPVPTIEPNPSAELPSPTPILPGPVTPPTFPAPPNAR
ncbi:MAG: M23 family metallopeptidase [Chloroflexi bacterium]|nr:M23 family metallopeptidase [Chloroflexota bacterium]